MYGGCLSQPNSDSAACCKSARTYSMHEGQLVIRKIVEIITTKCQILRLKGTKFDFRWGSALDPVGKTYSAPHTL